MALGLGLRAASRMQVATAESVERDERNFGFVELVPGLLNDDRINAPLGEEDGFLLDSDGVDDAEDLFGL